MSTIVNNLREKYPHNAAYTVGNISIDVFPALTEEPSKSIGTLAPGQTVAVDFVIILPDPLFPDWWVWGSLANADTPKYICLRKPLRNLQPVESVYLHFKKKDNQLERSDLIRIKEILSDTLARIEETPL